MGQITASAIGLKKDIICVLEYRYLHSEDIKYCDIADGWTFASASTWVNTALECKYAYLYTGPKITKYHRENTTEGNGSHV